MRTRGALLATVVAAVAAAWLAAPRDVAVASAAACGSGTHGPKGYAYAGVESVRVASGIRATITPLRAASVGAGHAAAWIGVGGPGEGPKGETVWLQAGVAALPNAPAMLYAEITRPGQSPVFLPLAREVPVGESHRLAVLEMAGRPGVWRIWVDGQPLTDPIALEGSHGLWKPIATAETWNGGTGSCNRFAFRFGGVAVALSPGGSWRMLEPGFTFRDRGHVVKQLRPTPGPRSLAGEPIEPYAFDALSA